MEFKDRQTQYPGRVKLQNVSTGVETTYDVTLAEGVVTEAGTPLVKSTFDQMKSDILNDISSNPNLKGAQGEKGDRGLPGSSNAKTLLVGTNTAGQEGWYKLGTFNVPVNGDYHAKWLITCTYNGTAAPSGEIDMVFRRNDPDWANTYVEWTHFNSVCAEYIKYYTAPNGTVTFYAYVPKIWAFYRIDILGESNRDNYNDIFVPAVPYGGVNTTRYSRYEPAGNIVKGIFKGFYNADSSNQVSPFSSANWNYGTVSHYGIMRRDGDAYILTLQTGNNIGSDRWVKIDLDYFGMANMFISGCNVSVRGSNLNGYGNYYPACYALARADYTEASDQSGVRYVIIGLDDKSIRGYTVTITCNK